MNPMSEQRAALIDLGRVDAWPKDLLEFLGAHHALFLDWEDGPTRCDGKDYDRAIRGLTERLEPYAIRGWHCTRLTDDEIAAILAEGLQLPDAAMLHRRIEALVAAGALPRGTADALAARNQADEASRAGMVWFCFFPPRVAGESGIACFFRHWGGEALYNSHEDDPVTGPAIRVIGTPCLVEADVPIASLPVHGGLSSKVARRFLVSRGHHTIEPVEHEDRIKRPLPAENIRRIIRFPEADFLTLTGCSGWQRALVEQ
jgi:hypothetical protein